MNKLSRVFSCATRWCVVPALLMAGQVAVPGPEGMRLAPAWLTQALAEPSPQEARRVETLLARVQARSDMSFIRNGSSHDASQAARFLRAKWDKARGGLQTAEQFVEQECTRSSTTGQAYKVRFKDGSEKPARDFLLDELRQVKG